MHRPISKWLVITTLFLLLLVSYFLIWRTLNETYDIAFPQFAGEASIRFGADSFDYIDLADRIGEGTFHDRWEGAPELFRAPGYPAFLYIGKLIFGNYNDIGLINIVMGAAAVVMLFIIGAKLFSERIAMLLAVIFAFEPTYLWQVMGISSDGPYMFLLIAALLLLVKFTLENKAYYAALGLLLLSSAALVRPFGQVIAGIALLYTLFMVWRFAQEKRLLVSALLIISFALPIVPWMARNYVVAGHFTLSTLPSYAMAMNNIPYHMEYKLGLEKDTLVREHGETLISVVGASDGEHIRTLRFAPQIDVHVRNYMKDNLLSYTFFQLTSVHRVLFSKNDLLTTWQLNPLIKIFNYIEQAFWAVVYLLALLGVFLYRKHRSIALFFFLLVGDTVLAVSPFEGSRYRLPIEPVVLILAGLGIASLFEKNEKP